MKPSAQPGDKPSERSSEQPREEAVNSETTQRQTKQYFDQMLQLVKQTVRTYEEKHAANNWRPRFTRRYGEIQKHKWRKSVHKVDKNLFGDRPT